MTYSGRVFFSKASRLFFSHCCFSLVNWAQFTSLYSLWSNLQHFSIYCLCHRFATFKIVPLRFNMYNSCIKTVFFYCRSVLPWDVLPVRGTLCLPALLLPSSPVPTTSCASLPSQKATSTSVAPTADCQPVSALLPSCWERTTHPPTDPTHPLLHKFHLNSSLNTFLS